MELTLSLYLKENNLSQFGALVLLSPLTTFETNLPSWQRNTDRDAVLGKINAVMYDITPATINPKFFFVSLYSLFISAKIFQRF
ncbi:MAG: hypothetical protein IK062_04355 [Selenomonadaceae bacterium]|nr:hypothetical protein [Selenomonadaceae bacterium]